MCCTPTDVKQRNPLGSAPVLEDEGSRRLQLDGRTPPWVRRAADTCHKLCGGVCGQCGVPRDGTRENERFVTVVSHVHLQQAIRFRFAPRGNREDVSKFCQFEQIQ